MGMRRDAGITGAALGTEVARGELRPFQRLALPKRDLHSRMPLNGASPRGLYRPEPSGSECRKASLNVERRTGEPTRTGDPRTIALSN